MDHSPLSAGTRSDRRAAAAAMLLVTALALGGCASLRWEIAKALRREGKTNLAFPEVVFAEYDCAKKRLPWLAVERSELIPPKLAAGGEFTHRLVYAMCPQRPTAVDSGDLVIRIWHKGRTIHVDRDHGYEIWPGRWQIDTFVQVPRDAAAGVYAYELAYRGRSLRFARRDSFLVSPR
jgi:hypothetical protein